MQGLSQPWQTKGAILPQSNLIQVAQIAVSITKIEIIIMCVKEKLHFQIYVHFISLNALQEGSLFLHTLTYCTKSLN